MPGELRGEGEARAIFLFITLTFSIYLWGGGDGGRQNNVFFYINVDFMDSVYLYRSGPKFFVFPFYQMKTESIMKRKENEKYFIRTFLPNRLNSLY